MPDPDLKSAYALNSLDETKQLYATWAETYDTSFAVEMDFTLPQSVAEAFSTAAAAEGCAGPVLDFGCGTGLCGAALARLGIGPVDGADLSVEMLAVAQRKGVYRDLISGNVLDGYQKTGAPYAGVVSSGTFTNGHVGPGAIEILLGLAAPGALFVLSIHAGHFKAAGFAEAFSALEGKITDLSLPEIRFYGDASTGAHKYATGYLATFRKV